MSRICSAGFRILHLEAEHVHGMTDNHERFSIAMQRKQRNACLTFTRSTWYCTQQPASHHSQKTSRLVNGLCVIVYYSRSFLWIGARKSYPQFHHPHRLLASSHVAALLHPQKAWVAGGSSQTLAYHDHDRQCWDVEEILSVQRDVTV